MLARNVGDFRSRSSATSSSLSARSTSVGLPRCLTRTGARRACPTILAVSRASCSTLIALVSMTQLLEVLVHITLGQQSEDVHLCRRVVYVIQGAVLAHPCFTV